MAKQTRELKEKEIEINGKIYGESSTIKLNVKTAVWIASSIIVLVLGILTYSYFDLKKQVTISHELFMKNANESMEKMESNINDIKLNQETIKGDIKLILDRQTRDNPIRTNSSINVQQSTPPISSDNNSDNNPNVADNN